MIKRSDYYICAFCGASLDIGEKCDCRNATERPKKPSTGFERMQAYIETLRAEQRQKTIEKALKHIS